MSEVSDQELRLYFEHVGPEAVQASVSGMIDTDLFWLGRADCILVLSQLVAVYKDCVTSFADAERQQHLQNHCVSHMTVPLRTIHPGIIIFAL